MNQLHFPLPRSPQEDRNWSQGGRSFYFFDFDDNVMFLSTPIYLFHCKNNNQKRISTGVFAQVQSEVGKRGEWADYRVIDDDVSGSFRAFRDSEKFPPGDSRHSFVSDVAMALKAAPTVWQGPTWDIFNYAVYNSRPVALITARGHHPDTLRCGFGELVKAGAIERAPNFFSIYPVSHTQTRYSLGDENGTKSIADLKYQAILAAVKNAFQSYGQNPHHRFGMSDDDPKNIELIISAMHLLKQEYPENSFFVIDSSTPKVQKIEILSHGERAMLATNHSDDSDDSNDTESNHAGYTKDIDGADNTNRSLNGQLHLL